MKQSQNIVVRLLLLVAIVLAFDGAMAVAQTDAAKSEEQPANLVDAISQFKSSSNALLTMQESELSKAEVKLAELKTLVADGLVAKAELEAEEQRLSVLRSQLEATQKQIADSEHMIAEVKAEQDLAKSQPARTVNLVSKSYGALSPTSTILRGNNFASWSLGNLDDIQGFFSSKFGHALPTSAIGQSATHNRLGYDHRNAVDVALHPDSAEGKSLINYLQSQGIPFLAFRGAIPGVATGPHIHIGRPSHRL